MSTPLFSKAFSNLLRDVALERFSDLLFRDGAHDLLDDLAILENQQRGDAANVVAAGGVHRFVDVQLGHLKLTRKVVSNFRDCWSEHVTRATPLRPEIDHYR